MLILNTEATPGHECDSCYNPGAEYINTMTGGFYCSAACDKRDTVRTHAAFPLMLREAAALKWPTHFQRDLTLHDRRDLARHEDSEPCLWFIRSMGTHLVYPLAHMPGHPAATFSAAPLAAIVGSIETNFRGDATRVYTWNGQTLTETTFAGAIETGNRWARDAHASRRLAA